ncbi:MAG: hypothetical protein V4507_12620 [Verrucomicrobiota bacterium]
MKQWIPSLLILIALGIIVWWSVGIRSSFATSKQSVFSRDQGVSSFDHFQEISSVTANSDPLLSKFTNTSLAAPASNIPTRGILHTSERGGTPAHASVKVGQKDFTLIPNEIGMFPRVLVPANGKIQIEVAYPEGTPEDPLVIQAEDGGLLDNGSVVKHEKLNQQKMVLFEFETKQEEGIYRVTLRKGTDEKRLDFWVGDEPKLQKGS